MGIPAMWHSLMSSLPVRVLLAVLVAAVPLTPRLPAQCPAARVRQRVQAPPRAPNPPPPRGDGKVAAAAGKLESAKGTLVRREAPEAKWQVVDAGGEVP